MRKIYAVTAAILAAGCLASSATAAPDPIKTLNRKVTVLEKQVKALRTDLAEAQSTLDCLGPVVPVAQFGGTFNGVPEGYVYGVGDGAAQQFFFTTGLDLINPTGLTAGVDYGLMMTWSGGCDDDPPASYRVQLRPVSADAAGRAMARFAW